MTKQVGQVWPINRPHLTHLLHHAIGRNQTIVGQPTPPRGRSRQERGQIGRKPSPQLVYFTRRCQRLFRSDLNRMNSRRGI